MTLKEDIEQNRKERMWYVEYWAEYLKKNPKQAWEEHKRFSDCMFRIAQKCKLTPKEYLEIKGEKCLRI